MIETATMPHMPAPSAADSAPDATDLFRTLEDRPIATAASPTATLILVRGRLIGFDAAGQPVVALPTVFPSCAVTAGTTVDLPADAAAGTELLVAVDPHDTHSAVVTGIIRAPESASTAPAWAATVDGRRVDIAAKDELVLRCGNASITLTAAGKVVIQGRYVLSRSTGPNKIKGAVIDIN